MSNGFYRLIVVGAFAAMTACARAAAPCVFEPQGEGRVSAVIDARSVRMDDGREVRLIGIEPAVPEKAAPSQTQALAAMVIGREVRLAGQDDTPDRYGRQLAFVWRQPDETLVQRELLVQGLALVSPTVDDKE